MTWGASMTSPITEDAEADGLTHSKQGLSLRPEVPSVPQRLSMKAMRGDFLSFLRDMEPHQFQRVDDWRMAVSGLKSV